MPYDRAIDGRVSGIISSWKERRTKRNMFGGVCYLLRGHMFCGIYQEFLILRLGEKGAQEALQSKAVRPLDITGRPMKGWVMVGKEGFKTDEELAAWLEEAKDYAMTLPPKKK